MKNINYKLIFKAILPIAVLLFLILISELRTEGSFGGFVLAIKIMFFFVVGLGIFLFTLIRNIYRIKRGNDLKESKMIITFLLIATFIGISSFWFPYDFFDKDPEFIALDEYGTKLTLVDGKYMLRTREIEWTTIDRGNFQLKYDTLYLNDLKTENFSAKRTNKYLIKKMKLIPIYANGMENDSTEYLNIELNKN